MSSEQSKKYEFVPGTQISSSKAREILQCGTWYHGTTMAIDPTKPSSGGNAKQSILETGFHNSYKGDSMFEPIYDEMWNKIQTPEDVLKYLPVYSGFTDAEKAEILSTPYEQAALQYTVDVPAKDPAFRRVLVEKLKSTYFYKNKEQSFNHAQSCLASEREVKIQKGEDPSEINAKPYVFRVLMPEDLKSTLHKQDNLNANQTEGEAYYTSASIPLDNILSHQDTTRPRRGAAAVQALLAQDGITASLEEAELVLSDVGSHSSGDEDKDTQQAGP